MFSHCSDDYQLAGQNEPYAEADPSNGKIIGGRSRSSAGQAENELGKRLPTGAVGVGCSRPPCYVPTDVYMYACIYRYILVA